MSDPMMVTGPQLLAAVDKLTADRATLKNGIGVTAAQLRKAGEILRDGPQPVCNGIREDMPGFIHADLQTGKSLVIQVGILPSRTYRIDKLGRARLIS